MKPQLRRVGESRSPVVVIDNFSGKVAEAVAAAAAMSPFPCLKGSLYPGLRRVITDTDVVANTYVEQLCNDAAQFIAGAFEYESFDLIEASLSMVTASPDDLAPLQRMPHFDSTDSNYLALLHFLRVPKGTGTAFFRQRSTGIEEVGESNVQNFIRTARQEAERMPPDSGYIQGSNALFEMIDSVEGVEDRLLIYRGSLLHSGLIPPHIALSDDPHRGRLTANIFVRGR
jgi:hypothetical protein